MRRLLEATASVAGSASDVEVVFTLAAADLKGTIGSNGSLRPYAFQFLGDPSAFLTVKELYTRMKEDPNQGRFMLLKSVNGWKLADINKLTGPDTDGIDCPRYEVADGYEFVIKVSNSDSGAVALTLAMKVANLPVGPIPASAADLTKFGFPQRTLNAPQANFTQAVGPGAPFNTVGTLSGLG